MAHAASTRWEIGPAAAGLYDGSLPSGAGALADSNGELAQRRQRFWDITLDGGTDVAYIQSNTEGWGRVGEESSFTGSVYSGEDGAYNVAGQAQPGLGRVFDGVAGWLDRHRWPSLPGEEQEEWEPPRTITHKVAHRARRLKALGNAVVPQQIYPILKYIVEYESGGRL